MHNALLAKPIYFWAFCSPLGLNLDYKDEYIHICCSISCETLSCYYLLRSWVFLILWDFELLLPCKTLPHPLHHQWLSRRPPTRKGSANFIFLHLEPFPKVRQRESPRSTKSWQAHYRGESLDTSSLISNVLQPLEVLYACPASDCKKKPNLSRFKYLVCCVLSNLRRGIGF